MKYEIKSKATCKVVFEAESEDAAGHWNFKKKMLLIGRETDKKLSPHILEYGIEDLVFSLKEKKTPVLLEDEEEDKIQTIIPKKRGRKRK